MAAPSPLGSKFINCLMYDGKKSTAQRVLLNTFDLIKTNGLVKCVIAHVAAFFFIPKGAAMLLPRLLLMPLLMSLPTLSKAMQRKGLPRQSRSREARQLQQSPLRSLLLGPVHRPPKTPRQHRLLTQVSCFCAMCGVLISTVEVLRKAIDTVMPSLGCSPVRKGASVYQARV
jgi:hypothetical protein